MANNNGLFGGRARSGIYGQDVPRQSFGGKDLYADQVMAPNNKYNVPQTNLAPYTPPSGGGGSGGGSTAGKIAGGIGLGANLLNAGSNLGLFGGGAAAGGAIAPTVGGATAPLTAPIMGGISGGGAIPAGGVAASGGTGLGGFQAGSMGSGLAGAGALALPIMLGLFGGPEQPSTVNADQDRFDALDQEYYDNMYAKAGVADAAGYQDMMQASDVWQTPMTAEEMARAEAERRGVGDIDEYMSQRGY